MLGARQTSTDRSDDSRSRVLSWPVALAAVASLSLYLHSAMWWTEPRDFTLFLRPWFGHIVKYGPVAAFAHPFSNYTPAYLYLLALASLFQGVMEPLFIIKLLSVAGTAFAAWAMADLVEACGGKPKYAVLLFIVPSVVINAALLAQCDALWAGACVFAVAAMIRGKTVSSLVWCGVAIAFKAQAIFVAPFIVGALIGRRAPLWQWSIPALTFVPMMVPAWLAGWPAWDLLMIYPSQPSWVPFPGRLANPWIFATVYAPDASRQFYWVGFAAAAASAASIVAVTSTAIQKPRLLLLLALLSSLALPFFFPKMLERYYFLGDLLSVALAIAYCSRATVLIAIAIQVASLLSILSEAYFYQHPYPTFVGALFATAALVGTFVLARRSGAAWPKLSSPAARPLPASASRTAA